MELNREQIIKALECCQFRHIKKNCDECKYHRWIEPACRDLICQDALALINSQEQRIKELTEENDRQVDTNFKLVVENVMFMLDKTVEDINKIGAVRHGHWISENRRPKSYQFRCSVCDGVTYYLHRNEKGEKQCLYKYCPHCGAKMEMEEGKI